MTDSAAAEVAKEFEAMKTIHATLSELPHEARARVLSYLANVLGIATGQFVPASAKTANRVAKGDGSADQQVEDRHGSNSTGSVYDTFAEFCNAANPENGVERVLVAGYWLQVIGKEDGFGSQDANRELKHLGHQSTNITRDLDHLQSGSPKLVIQVKKAGNTKQARKLYKLTHAGTEKVKDGLHKPFESRPSQRSLISVSSRSQIASIARSESLPSPA